MSNSTIEQLQRAQALMADLFAAQQYLISAENLTKDEWELVSVYLQSKDYFDVVEERNCNHHCGYCFCDVRTLTLEEYQMQKMAKIKKEEPKFNRSFFDPVIDVPEKIYQYSNSVKDFIDIKEQLYYCSKACYVDSNLLAKTLDTLPLNLRKLPFKNFGECIQALVRLQKKKDEDVSMEESDESVLPSFKERTKQQQLNKIKQDLYAINAIENEVVIKENVETNKPSEEFQSKIDMNDQFSSTFLQPMDLKSMPKLQLSLFSEMSIFLRDFVSDKTKNFVNKLDEEKTTNSSFIYSEEFTSYSIPPLSASFKRFETLEKAITKE